MSQAAQQKTVPFPGTKPTGMPKDVPTVNMNHPALPLVEKFAVPLAWFAAGVVLSRIFWPRTKHVAFSKAEP